MSTMMITIIYKIIIVKTVFSVVKMTRIIRNPGRSLLSTLMRTIILMIVKVNTALFVMDKVK